MPELVGVVVVGVSVVAWRVADGDADIVVAWRGLEEAARARGPRGRPIRLAVVVVVVVVALRDGVSGYADDDLLLPVLLPPLPEGRTTRVVRLGASLPSFLVRLGEEELGLESESRLSGESALVVVESFGVDVVKWVWAS